MTQWKPIDWCRQSEVSTQSKNQKVQIIIEGPLITKEQSIEVREFIVMACSAIDTSPKPCEPQPFWKPIEQCPKVEGKRYLLALKEIKMPLVARWNDRYGEWCSISKEPYYDEEFTHYAEIPPLEAGE